MKPKSNLLILAVLALSFAAAVECPAQYQAVGAEGIAASPKGREILNERSTLRGTAENRSVSHSSVGADGIAASPKVRAMLEAKKVVPASAGNRAVSYSTVDKEGIAASPKGRAMID